MEETKKCKIEKSIKIKKPINSCYHCEQENIKLNWCKVYVENWFKEYTKNDNVFEKDSIHEGNLESCDDCMNLLENIQEGIELCDDCLFEFRDIIKPLIELGAMVETTNISIDEMQQKGENND